MDIKTRKNITKYNNIFRCCYLLNNGERCKNKCVGLKYLRDLKTNKYKPIFIMQCKKHRKICEKKYITYKNICNKVYTKKQRKKFLRYNICNKYKNNKIIDNINKCALGRLNFPVNCTNGCIIDPFNKKSFELAINNQKKHFFEVENLINNKLTCKKYNY